MLAGAAWVGVGAGVLVCCGADFGLLTWLFFASGLLFAGGVATAVCKPVFWDDRLFSTACEPAAASLPPVMTTKIATGAITA